MENTYPEFYQEIQARIGQPIPTEMAQASVKRYKEMLEIYRDRIEDSFLCACLPLLLKPTHQEAAARKRKFDEMAGLESGVRYEPTYWADEGLVVGCNELFKPGWLPSPFEDDLLKQMKKDDGTTNAKPDRIIGFNSSTLPIPPALYFYSEMEDCLTVLQHLYHPFFLVEGKSNEGLIATAYLQLRRGGASLVYAHRCFLDKIGVPDIEQGADKRTHVFSMAITPDVITIWVHWAEKLANGIIHYHMDGLDGISTLVIKEMPRIRRILENVQSWGLTERLEDLRKQHKEMHAWLARKMEYDHAEAQKTKLEKKGAGKKRKQASKSATESVDSKAWEEDSTEVLTDKDGQGNPQPIKQGNSMRNGQEQASSIVFHSKCSLKKYACDYGIPPLRKQPDTSMDCSSITSLQDTYLHIFISSAHID